MILLISLAWYITGLTLFIRWWTQEIDFTLSYLFLALCVGICGPCNVIFYIIDYFDGESANYDSVILFKSRKK